jgi:hypothetical protein
MSLSYLLGVLGLLMITPTHVYHFPSHCFVPA